MHARLPMNTPFSVRIYAIFAVTFSLCGSAVSAAVFNITNGDIAGLNAAITIANGNAQDDTINLARAGSYVLTVAQNLTDGPTGLAVIQSDGGHALLINGNGALLQRSTASGTPNFRILNVGSGNVTIINL